MIWYNSPPILFEPFFTLLLAVIKKKVKGLIWRGGGGAGGFVMLKNDTLAVLAALEKLMFEV